MERRRLLASLQLSPAEGQAAAAYPPAEQVLPQFLQLFASGGKAQAGMVRDLWAILEAVDWPWLLGAGLGTSPPLALRDLVVALSSYAALPQQEHDGGELPAKDPAYAAAADRAADVSLVFQGLLSKVEAAKGSEAPGSRAVGPLFRQVAGPLYVFAATHAAEKPWSRARTRARAQELLEGLLQVGGCQAVPEFLRGAAEGEEGWFAVVMQALKPELTK